MTMKHRVFVILLVIMVMAPMTRADLSYTEPQAPLDASPGQATVEAVFPFRNTGDYPVTVTGVRGVGDRISAALQTAQRTFRPGEAGEVRATVRLMHRQGGLSEKFTVVTDDRAAPVRELSIRVNVPRLVSVQPAVLVWRPGEPMEAKTVAVIAGEGQKVKVLGAEVLSVGGPIGSARPGGDLAQPDDRPQPVKVDVKEDAAAERYTLTVTPPARAPRLRSFLLKLKTDLPEAFGPGPVVRVIVTPEKPATQAPTDPPVPAPSNEPTQTPPNP